jgi:valyl-tRNA synthetase
LAQHSLHGALKITPGHDPTDYEIGARHGLPIISMFDREAKVTEAGGPYKGMDRFDARKQVWADMQAAKLTVKTEPYTLNVPRSQRGGEIVEPMIRRSGLDHRRWPTRRLRATGAFTCRTL